MRQQDVDAILLGKKRCEIRAGREYADILPGDVLVINETQLELTVKHTVAFPDARSAARALDIDEAELHALYPEDSGPFSAFLFDPPESITAS